MSITMSCDPMRHDAPRCDPTRHDIDTIHRTVPGTNWWRNNRCARTVCE
jgi:hypothetical protein